MNKALIPAIVIGLILLLAWAASAVWLWLRRRRQDRQPPALELDGAAGQQTTPEGRLSRWHRRIVGLAIVFYGVYLAALTGSMTKFVLPGLGAIGGGAAAGAGVGLLTALVIGTVGVATGGAGIALGALGMALIGGGVGAAGGVVGGAGFRVITYPLVSPWFWGPVVVLGIYLLVGVDIKRKLASKTDS